MPVDPLRRTFDHAATTYQHARPDYPSDLYSHLLTVTGIEPGKPGEPSGPGESGGPGRSGTHLLEVGCGPGKATLPLARAGFRITAIELGTALAAQARHHLADFPAVSVITSSFEDWQPPADARFDLVYAATAWKWVDPKIKYAKAASLLDHGGHLAGWNADHAFPPDFDPFFTEIQQVYDALGEGPGDPWPPPEIQPDHTAAELHDSGLFTVVERRPYVWGLRYTADEYIALLDTFSGHIAMDPDRRRHLYEEIRRLLAARPDGRLTRHWSAVLTIGRRL